MGPLQRLDIELLYLQERLRHPGRGGLVLARQQLVEDLRHHLPGDAVAVLAPAALLGAGVGGELLPEPVHLLLVLAADFWTTTSNKQLNFVQHVKSLLEIHGRAAVVVPDNVLFEGGVGETVRRKLLHECDVHTLLRLPTGIFYAQGVKANVLFFDRKPGAKEPWTKKVWVYDLRTNKHFTLKTKTMTRADLDEFVECYKPGERQKRKATWSEKHPEARWRPYTYDEIVARDKVSLDLFWLRDESLEDSANLPDPNVLAQEIADDLRSALGQIEDILGDLDRRARANDRR